MGQVHVVEDFSPIPDYPQLRCVVPSHEGDDCWVTGAGLGPWCTSVVVMSGGWMVTDE